jgi:hypothetical protein
MSVTLAQLKQRVRDNCYGPYPTSHPFASVLGAAIATTGTTTVTVADGTDWAEGDVLEVEETGEQCMVRSVATNDLTVIRNWNNSGAATAADAGTVLKNPRFTQTQILDAINQSVGILEQWGIHGFGTGSIAYDAAQKYFELSETDIIEPFGVLSLYAVEDNTQIPRALPFKRAYFGVSTTPSEYTYGAGLIVLDWGALGSGESAYYTYAKRLTTTTLSESQAELVVLGAVASILGKGITPRTQDPGARTDRTVQPGQESRDGRWFQGEFYVRARVEAANVAVRRQNFPSTTQYNRARRWRH